MRVLMQLVLFVVGVFALLVIGGSLMGPLEAVLAAVLVGAVVFAVPRLAARR